MRKYYLDNIRWATVLTVILYHVVYIFNAQGVLGGLPPFFETQYWDAILYFLYPWFMVLLFLVAGISARHALEKRTNREFIRSRTLKLLVPSTIGLLVFQWLGGLVNMGFGMGWDNLKAIPIPVRYPIAALSGTGPLWFAQLLWLYSLLTPGMKKLDRENRFYDLCGRDRVSLGFTVFGFLLLWLSGKILNMPVVVVYRFGIYFMAYLLGWFVFSHESAVCRLAKAAKPLCAAAAVTGIIYSAVYYGEDYTSKEILRNLFTVVYSWLAILAVLGGAKRWTDRKTVLTEKMSEASYGMYVLHYTVLVYTALLTKQILQLNVLSCYSICILSAFGVTYLLQKIIKKIPFLRWCVLGIREKGRKKREVPAGN